MTDTPTADGLEKRLRALPGEGCDCDRCNTHRQAADALAKARVALRRIASDHTGDHLYDADCDACHRIPIARTALGLIKGEEG